MTTQQHYSELFTVPAVVQQVDRLTAGLRELELSEPTIATTIGKLTADVSLEVSTELEKQLGEDIVSELLGQAGDTGWLKLNELTRQATGKTIEEFYVLRLTEKVDDFFAQQ